jgi:hypothetical protein
MKKIPRNPPTPLKQEKADNPSLLKAQRTHLTTQKPKEDVSSANPNLQKIPETEFDTNTPRRRFRKARRIFEEMEELTTIKPMPNPSPLPTPNPLPKPKTPETQSKNLTTSETTKTETKIKIKEDRTVQEGDEQPGGEHQQHHILHQPEDQHDQGAQPLDQKLTNMKKILPASCEESPMKKIKLERGPGDRGRGVKAMIEKWEVGKKPEAGILKSENVDSKSTSKHSILFPNFRK